EGRLGAGDLGFRPRDRRLILGVLDGEEQVTLLHLLTLGEMPPLEEALDAGAQINRVDRLDTAVEAGRRRDRLAGDRRYGDGGRRRLGGNGSRLLGLVAGGDERCR